MRDAAPVRGGRREVIAVAFEERVGKREESREGEAVRARER